MNEKEAIKKLLKVAKNQQKIITKLAQALNPGQMGVSYEDTRTRSHDHKPPPTKVDPKTMATNEAKLILSNLHPTVKSVVANLAVNKSDEYSGEVLVKFHPGKASDAAFNAVQSTVQKLQNQNKLPGGSYLVKEVL